MTTFTPTGYPDGLVSGWTAFSGYELGKSQADVANRFVVYNGGYINWNISKTIYQTATSSRPNHYIKVSLTNNGGDCGVFWNSNAAGTSYHSFVQNGTGWSYNYDGGGMSSGTLSGGAAVTTGVAYDVEIDASTAGTPVIKVNGTVVAVGSASTARTGLYVGVYLGAGNDAGIIQVEPAGGGSTPISSSDTGSGADAGTLSATLTVTDTGSGADSQSILVTITQTDTGSGADTNKLTLPNSDTGSGADGGTVAVSLTVTDTGSGADTQSLLVTITQTDTGSGADSQSVNTSGNSPISGSDTGSGADAQTTSAALPQTDTGAGADVATVRATLTVTDTGSGADSQSVLIQVAVSQSDTGSGADSQSVSILVNVAKSASDTGTGSETQNVRVTHPGPNGPYGFTRLESFTVSQRLAYLSRRKIPRARPVARWPGTRLGGS